nr:hypothetical protein [Nostoc sp. EkiNYC01]
MATEFQSLMLDNALNKAKSLVLKYYRTIKLDEAAAQLRQEITSVQEWMSSDTGDWICPIDLAPLVWNQLINIRDNIAPGLRNQLKVDYESGLEDYQERIDQFLSLQTWKLSLEKQEDVKANLLRAFPTLTDLEDYLQVVIGRPVIIPALSEQLDHKQAECLEQITRFIQQYDSNLEQRLRESALEHRFSNQDEIADCSVV